MAATALEKILQEVELYFAPLIRSVQDSEQLFQLFEDMGWYLQGHIDTSSNGFLDNLAVIAHAVEEIIAIAENPPDDIDGLLPLIREIQPLLRAIIQLPDSLADLSVVQLSELPRDLLLHLTKLYIFNKSPFAYRLLELLTIIHPQAATALVVHDETLLRAPVSTLDLSRIPDLFTDPAAVFAAAYWPDGFTDLATTSEVARRLFTRLGELLITLGIIPFYGRGDSPEVFSAEEAARLDSYITFWNKLSLSNSGEAVILGTSLGLLPENEGGPGVIILPFGTLELFEVLGDWGLGVEVNAAAGGVQITGDGFSIVEGTAAGLGASLRLQKLSQQEGVALLLGDIDGTRFEIASFAIEGGFDLYAQRQEVYLLTRLDGMKLVVKGGEGDGFLNSILSEDGLVLESSLAVGYSTETGFHIKGSGGLQIFLPTKISLGPIELQGLTVALKFTEQGEIPLELGANIAANLGPLVAVVENMGLRLTLSFPDDNTGNLGPANLDFRFKPPNGVGLSIDAGAVSGGGYLFFDFEREEYAGVLELDLNGIVNVKAIGLIATRLPDGSKGFSMLLIITAEFGSPIQLGLGFTLSGVGGLLGLNRTMRLDVIVGGIRDGGINSIMFPQNVVANAPRIISDLKTYFPIAADTFLIGPMVKIGWGTPNLVKISLGIIIEIPGNIAILGVLKVALPDEEAALIVIQVSFIGAIEFDKQRLWFFASLFESRVLFITLEGEMGLLVGWGDTASFVVSVGGFHPAFEPPPLPFGSIARIALSILNTDYARIRVMGYFAVTSNSVQFGAAVELFFGVNAFNIDGHLAFDALFRFSPFYFIISISAALAVKVFGIGLFSIRMRGSLEGPTPWHVEGTGRISLLFFKIDVDFSHTWGDSVETSLPPISVMPLLVAELNKLENWQLELPARSQLLVTLRSAASTTDLILHPVGRLKISQRALPLDVRIDKVGNQKPNDAEQFSIAINSAGLTAVQSIQESFAIGQYFTKSDNELLNAKSFEPLKGGIVLAASGAQNRTSAAVKRLLRYEQIIIDTQWRRHVRPFVTLLSGLFGLFLKQNAVRRSVLSAQQHTQQVPFAEQIAIKPPLYAVALNSNNTAYHANSINFTSAAQAQDYLQQQLTVDPGLIDQLHVIPQVEMQEAA